MSKARDLGRDFVRWLYRSGHRDRLTANLAVPVAGLDGVVIDVGGGRDSPLAKGFRPSVVRVRLDISFEFGPDVQADGTALPFADSSADGVLMSEMLEHVAQPQLVIDEVLRVLQPGGRLIGSVPFLCQGIHADPHDYNRYTDQALRFLMRGFDEVTITPHGNASGVAWRMVLSQLRFLIPLNPLFRQISRGTDADHAEGYTFVAVKALD